MHKKECIAMVLAGGQGSRLSALTTKIPKPAIPFGGKCRLIDFSLSNCTNSGINTIGILTAKKPFEITNNVDFSTAVELFPDRSVIHTIPPRNGAPFYTGTANAVYENINFIESFSPEYVLILSGDHVYNMDYGLFMKHHKENKADLTISVIEVPWADASRFGIISTNLDGSIADFAEKPSQPKSNLASMGIYLFSWPKLKQYLEMDENNRLSCHDFGKNIIPSMLSQGEKLYTYSFKGYWKDVGTIESLYQAHMDLLSDPPVFNIHDVKWPIYSTLKNIPPHEVIGKIERSVIFPGTYIGDGAQVKNSVIMTGARIESGAYIEQAIIGPDAVIESGCTVIGYGKQPVAVIAQNAVIASAPIEFGT